MAATNAFSRNLGLDLVRLVAILLVIGNHLATPPAGGATGATPGVTPSIPKIHSVQ